MNSSMWVLYGVLLISQNFAFTFVSRARNSGSLTRHLIASVVSNAVWFSSQTVMLTSILDILRTGSIQEKVVVGVYYTACTILGSMAAHWWSLRSEKGNSSVGASHRYAQIPTVEWEKVKSVLAKELEECH